MPEVNYTENDISWLIEKDKARECTIKALNSILSEIAGHTTALSLAEEDFRYNQLEEADSVIETHINTKRLSRPLNHLIGRMDQIAVHKFINYLQKSGTSEAADILRQCSVKYEKADLEKATQLVKDGNRVAMITLIQRPGGEQLHMFHLGINEEGIVLNLSDFPKPYAMNPIETQTLAEFTKVPQESTHAWNIISFQSHLAAGLG